jgi:hypothetical protein
VKRKLRTLLLIASAFLLGWFVHSYISRPSDGNENKYPNTAQQAGAIYLQSVGKRLAAAILYFRSQHDRWPATLSELLQDGNLNSHDLLYPRIYDLPDRRDILGFADGLEWIYIPPNEQRVGLPLLIAPIPYTSSMGRRLKRPKRIIVNRETIPEAIEEHEVTKLIRNLTNA